MAQQPALIKLDQKCQQGGSFARGGFKNIYAVGRAEVVLPAVKRFQQVWPPPAVEQGRVVHLGC